MTGLAQRIADAMIDPDAPTDGECVSRAQDASKTIDRQVRLILLRAAQSANVDRQYKASAVIEMRERMDFALRELGEAV